VIEGDSWSSTAEWFIVGKYHSFSFPVALIVEKNKIGRSREFRLQCVILIIWDSFSKSSADIETGGMPLYYDS